MSIDPTVAHLFGNLEVFKRSLKIN